LDGYIFWSWNFSGVKIMKEPKKVQAQEFVNWCNKMDKFEWVEWYNFRLKILREQNSTIIITRRYNKK